jgi:integrase
VAKETPTTANRAFEVLRRIYNWSADGELVSCANPCARLAKPSPERRRERVYSDDELGRVLAASAGTEVEALVRLAMLTLLRSGEMRAIRLGWISDADKLGAGLLTIPAEVTKNGSPHPVPLVTDAVALLEGFEVGGQTSGQTKADGSPSPVQRARAAAESRGLPAEDAPLFPAATKAGYLDSPHKVMSQVGGAAGVRDFRLHDIRRTGAARMEVLGVESDTIEAALGHSRPSLHRTYRPAFPEAKVRAALRALADHYRDALGPAWWEPDEARRAALVRLMESFEL